MTEVFSESIKNAEFLLKEVAELDPVKEETMRRWSWYSYNFHILALKKRQERQQAASSNM